MYYESNWLCANASNNLKQCSLFKYFQHFPHIKEPAALERATLLPCSTFFQIARHHNCCTQPLITHSKIEWHTNLTLLFPWLQASWYRTHGVISKKVVRSKKYPFTTTSCSSASALWGFCLHYCSVEYNINMVRLGVGWRLMGVGSMQ